MTPEQLKEALASLNTAITAEREANDARIKEIETKGAATAETLAKIGNIEADIVKIQNALTESSKTMARLAIGGNGDDRDAKALKRDAFLFAAMRTGRPVEDVKDADVEAYAEYCKAFEIMVRRGGSHGEILSPEVQASLQVGSDSDGAFWVPASVASFIQTRLFESSDMRSICTVQPITSDTYEIPLDTNEAESGGWVSEKQDRGDTGTPRTGTQKIEVFEQFAQPKATQRLLDDAVVNVEQWLGNKIADKLVRTENASFVSGDGNGKPTGFLKYASAAVTTADKTRKWGLLQYVASGSAAGFPTVSGTAGTYDNPDCLIDVMTALKPAYRQGAVWVMNRASEAKVRKLKDRDGRYLVGFGDIKEGTVSFPLFGSPIKTGEDMPDISSGTFPIAFGNFKEGYTIVDRQGFRVLRDPFTQKPFVKFYTTKRVGGDVTNFDAIKLLKIA